MFVPGAKRASAAGLMSDGAGRPGVVEAEAWVSREVSATAEVWARWSAGGNGQLAEVVVSKNAVIVTDVLFPTANVVMVKLAEVWPPGTLTMPGA